MPPKTPGDPTIDGTDVSHWERMSLKELHESGLLAQANAATFWPLGLALTVAGEKNEETGELDYQELCVQKLEPFDVVVSGDDPREAEERANRLANWIRERLR